MRHTDHKLYKGSTLALRCKFQKTHDGRMSIVREEAKGLSLLDDRTPDEQSYMEAMQADLADYNAEFE